MIDPEKMKQYKYPSKKASYSEKQIMLYSVSIGLGRNPLNKKHMKFVYERDESFQAFPTMPIIGALGSGNLS